MTILFAGGEMGAYIPSDSSCVETTANSVYNSSFSRCAIGTGSSTSAYYDSAQFTAVTDGYYHGGIGAYAYPSGTITPLVLLDGSDVEVIRLRYNYSTSALTLQYWNGSAWTDVGSITLSLSTLQDMDLHFVVNSASGSLRLYVSGTKRIEGTGINLSGVASIRRHRIYAAGYGPRISQNIVADEPTIGWRVTTVPPTGAGATTDWTGGYTEVDEITVSDADFVNSDTANEVELFSHSTTIPSGYTVRAVAVTARARCGASGPQNLQLALRSSGTTYFSGSKALDVGYGAFVHIWETDPATSAAFTNASANSFQFGVKSIT